MNDPLKCGDCGGDTFTISHQRADGVPRVGGGGYDPGSQGTMVDGDLTVTCVSCGESSTLSVSLPQLTVHGNLCGGWSKEKK